MPKKIKVSILIVYYKEKEEILKCIKSIKNSRPNCPYEIIVVDNSSSDEIRKVLKEYYPKVRFIKSPGNIGFGSGNNLGAKQALGEYLFILNPDSRISENTLDILLNFSLNRGGKCAVAPMLYHSNGKKYRLLGSRVLTPYKALFTLTFINKIFPNNPVSRKFWYKMERNTPYKIEIIPGLFMIKKDLFKKLGGFDEKFFLYFEDTDFAKRIFNYGIPSYILPRAKVIHIGGSGTKGKRKIQEIFSQSRYYYFKKHYGLFWAATVHILASLSKWILLLSAILLLATFLRFYRIQENFIFIGENGLDYLRIKGFLDQGILPLFGPQTSHPWFSIAPLFYWLFMLVMPLGRLHPVTGAYFFAGVSVIGIYLFYYVISKLLDKKTGLICAFICAISPSWISYTRAARYNFVVSFLFLPFLYLLVKIQKENKERNWRFFYLFLIMGLMFSFFPSPFVLLPAVLFILFIQKKLISKYNFLYSLFGIILPNIPYIIGIIDDKYTMIIKITQWIPYRILGFIGVFEKNRVNLNIIKSNIFSLFNFFRESFVIENNILSFLLVFSVFIFFTFNYLYKRDKNIIFRRTLTTIFIISYSGLFLHGDPPPHYYFVIFPIPLILLGEFLSRISEKKIGIFFVVIILSFITYSNLRYYFSEKWFYIPQDRVIDGKLPVPFNLQENITDFIIEDSKGKKFALRRIGELDKFNDDFAQNYIYLLDIKGVKPVQNSDLIYSIIEDELAVKNNQKGEIFWISNVAIIKERL